MLREETAPTMPQIRMLLNRGDGGYLRIIPKKYPII